MGDALLRRQQSRLKGKLESTLYGSRVFFCKCLCTRNRSCVKHISKTKGLTTVIVFGEPSEMSVVLRQHLCIGALPFQSSTWKVPQFHNCSCHCKATNPILFCLLPANSSSFCFCSTISFGKMAFPFNTSAAK